LSVRASLDAHAESARIAQERWIHIVAGLRHLIHAYNGDVEPSALTVTEHRDGAAVAVAIAAAGDRTLRATIEDAMICVTTRDESGGETASEFPLHSERSDAGTATHILQPWLERL
jgi:hypothetical protein